ncbi:MAG: hypothetical protein ACJAVV_002310 [Alphaproteobacteria bacterium]
MNYSPEPRSEQNSKPNYFGNPLVSLQRSKKHLHFTALRNEMASCFSAIPDSRQQSKCSATQHDSLMSAFAYMFFQDPSLLHFQKRLEQHQQRNNLRNWPHPPWFRFTCKLTVVYITSRKSNSLKTAQLLVYSPRGRVKNLSRHRHFFLQYLDKFVKTSLTFL